LYFSKLYLHAAIQVLYCEIVVSHGEKYRFSRAVREGKSARTHYF
jgi:hypothetical protein